MGYKYKASTEEDEGTKITVKCRCGAKHTVLLADGESTLPRIIECDKCSKANAFFTSDASDQ
jgi:hypothetical protein